MSIPQFPRVSTAILLAALLVGCSGLSNPPAMVVSNSPTVLMVVPQTNGVGTNRAVAVVFSTQMDPASINAGTFMVAGVSGTVTYGEIEIESGGGISGTIEKAGDGNADLIALSA